MAEREPAPSPAFNEAAVASALHTWAATVRDVAYGEGHQFSAGQGRVRLEIFPRTGVTRLTTQGARCGEATPAATAAVGNGGGERPTSQDTSVNHEGEERVRVSGRLGRYPSFYTTRSGKRVAKFPLAVPQAGGRTSWHDVLVFDERADELRKRAETGQLGRGNAVDVVGYWHENQKPGRDGTARTVRDLYAASVQQPSPRTGA